MGDAGSPPASTRPAADARLLHFDDRRDIEPYGSVLTTPSTASLLRSMPFWPLAATLAVQTLATMALYSLPAVAPEVARDLNVSGTLIGSFVALAYGVGILSALVSPGLVRRYGGVRATQAVLLAAAGMLAFAALGSGVAGLALAAIVLGLG
jgi:hypothetical protein